MSKSVIARILYFITTVFFLSSKKSALLWAILALDRTLGHAGRVLDSVELAQLVPTLWNAYLTYCAWANLVIPPFLGF